MREERWMGTGICRNKHVGHTFILNILTSHLRIMSNRFVLIMFLKIILKVGWTKFIIYPNESLLA